MDEAVGGTKIQRKGASPAAQAQQAMAQQQMMGPPQMQSQPQMMSDPEPSYYMPPTSSAGFAESLRDVFSTGMGYEIKYAVIATLLFVVFNSKIVWKQLLKVPIMGGVEPSVVALGTNGLLFAIIFYIIIKYLK
jgi:hypothetical protein